LIPLTGSRKVRRLEIGFDLGQGLKVLTSHSQVPDRVSMVPRPLSGGLPDEAFASGIGHLHLHQP
jgi:hypothetical protein